MEQICRKIIIMILALMTVTSVFAYDCEINGIYYNRIGTTELEVAPFKGDNAYGSEKNANAYKGKVIIPSNVTYNGRTFEVTGIGANAFYGCTSMTSITIPKSIKTIGKGAFSGCENLSSYFISDLASWCSIDFKSPTSNPIFYVHKFLLNGKEIKELVIPEGVKSIGDYAFYSCSGLTSISISNSVTSIGSNAFQDCLSVKKVKLSNTLSRIESYLFYGCTSITSITIPNSIESIGSNAFNKCTSLASIYIPNGLISIQNHAFENCTSLKSINLPNSVAFLNQGAFQGCTSLKLINIPNNFKSIASDLFSGCSSLTTMVLGDKVREIGNHAFEGTSSLTSLYMFSTVPPTIYETTFSNDNYVWTDLYVPKGCTRIYKQRYAWDSFKSIIEFDATSVNIVSDEDVKESVCYFLDGQKVSEPKRGINIIKMNDGTTRKVVVK